MNYHNGKAETAWTERSVVKGRRGTPSLGCENLSFLDELGLESGLGGFFKNEGSDLIRGIGDGESLGGGGHLFECAGVGEEFGEELSER